MSFSTCDSGTRKSSPKSERKNFLERSTLPGFSHSQRRGGGRTFRYFRWHFRRSKLWFLSGLVGLVLTTGLVAYVFYDFLQFEINTKIEIESPESLDFPALTVCGFNRISCFRLAQTVNKSVALSRADPEGGGGFGKEELEDISHRLCKILVLTECEEGNEEEGMGAQQREAKKAAMEACEDFVSSMGLDAHEGVGFERLNFTMPPSMSYGELIGMSTQDVGDIRRWSREELEWVRQNTDAGNSLLDATLGLLPYGIRSQLAPFVTDILMSCRFGLSSDCSKVQEQTVPVLQPDCFEAGNGERSLSEIVKFRQRHMDGEAPGRRIHVDKIPTKEGTCFYFNLLGTLGSTSSTGNGESIQMVLKTREQGGTRLGVEHGIDGASVTVHPPFQIPPKHDFMLVAPHTSSFIELEERELVLQGWPYRDGGCVSDWSGTTIVGYSQLAESFTYKRSSCRSLCRLLKAKKSCGCAWDKVDDMNLHYFMREKGKEDGKECLVKICDHHDPEVLKCVRGSYVDNPEEECGCQSPCSAKSYAVQMTSAQWPSEHTWKFAAEEFGVIPPANFNPDNSTLVSQWRAETDNSLAMIHVQFVSRKKEVTREIPAYSMLSLVSTFGGAMAIFMGISAFAYFELAECLYDSLLGAMGFH